MTSETVPPLNATPLTEVVDPPSEKWLMWLPPFGWLWNQLRWQRRAGPNRSAYEMTLRERPDIPVSVWGNAHQQAVASKLLTIIDDNFGWPNTRFVPWDPVCVAMWAYEDGLDDTAAMSDIETAFGVVFADDEWLEHYNRTLIELIDIILDHTRVAS